MKTNRLLRVSLKVAALFTAILALVSSAWAAPKYKVLHAFGKGTDGAGLWSSVVMGPRGDLFGTTSGGGDPQCECGVVFEITPRSDGSWSEKVLHRFHGTDGAAVFGGIILDSQGNLYGTTAGGGTAHYGTVFELSPHTRGWKETLLYSFPQPPTSHGCCPKAAPVLDAAGNLYGTAGYPFVLRHGVNGWSETALHIFCKNNDGCEPWAGLIWDRAGNLYGTTQHGGNNYKQCGGCGTVYELQHLSDGTWRESIIHNFGVSHNDGGFPSNGALVFDHSGNLYGTTSAGTGLVYKLVRDKNGRWRESIVHRFPGGTEGDHPNGGVVFDKSGNLYGTTFYGGDAQCQCGLIYQLSPQAGGQWKYTVLYRFTGFVDGANPAGNLVVDAQGNIYGGTVGGSPYGGGVAFEITP